MSSNEYNDLFLKAQSIGIYHVFTFDIVDSKKMTRVERLSAQKTMIKLMTLIYSHIKSIEQEQNSKILVFEKDFSYYESNEKLTKFGMKIEPFVFGDTFGFTIYRNTLSIEDIKRIFYLYYSKLNIKFDFHIENGFYETNDYESGATKYFRGYCIDTLSNLHKSEYTNVKKRIQ